MIKVLSFLSHENCLAGHGLSTTDLLHYLYLGSHCYVFSE